MNLQNVFKLFQVIMSAAGNPLVTKFIDNMVAGTPTKVDDWVWGALRVVLTGGSVNEVVPALDEVQAKYDENPDEAKQPNPALLDFENV